MTHDHIREPERQVAFARAEALRDRMVEEYCRVIAGASAPKGASFATLRAQLAASAARRWLQLINGDVAAGR